MATSQGGYVNGGFDLLKAPNAPTITSVETSIGSVSVAFTAPANPGGSAVTGFTVTAINESTGASVGATGSGSPISVPITVGGTFKVRTAAANIYGPGRVSEFDTGNVVFSGASLWGWGRNNFGKIGDGTVVYRSSPVQIGALTTWSQVSAGNGQTASIKTDGTMWAWGYNSDGQLGQNDRINRSSPVQIGALTTWYQVSAGYSHTVSVKADGTLWSWGSGFGGGLGDGTISNRSSPVQIGGLTTWSQVSAGNGHTASIKTDGTMWTWGNNDRGQLGQNIAVTVSRSSPVQVGSLTNWLKVSAAVRFTAAIKTDGTLWAWGYNNSGQLGDGTVINRSSPVQVGALTTWYQVSAGVALAHIASIKTDGTLWTWGRNVEGQLGDGTVINRSSPVQIGALTNWAKVAVGRTHTASIKTDGTMWAWGNNEFGGLGQNNIIYRSSPVQIGALTNWAQLAAGNGNTLALYGVT
jgi:alpha-tubulin suppressor-like RCC1 family protein